MENGEWERGMGNGESGMGNGVGVRVPEAGKPRRPKALDSTSRPRAVSSLVAAPAIPYSLVPIPSSGPSPHAAFRAARFSACATAASRTQAPSSHALTRVRMRSRLHGPLPLRTS